MRAQGRAVGPLARWQLPSMELLLAVLENNEFGHTLGHHRDRHEKLAQWPHTMTTKCGAITSSGTRRVLTARCRITRSFVPLTYPPLSAATTCSGACGKRDIRYRGELTHHAWNLFSWKKEFRSFNIISPMLPAPPELSPALAPLGVLLSPLGAAGASSVLPSSRRNSARRACKYLS